MTGIVTAGKDGKGVRNASDRIMFGDVEAPMVVVIPSGTPRNTVRVDFWKPQGNLEKPLTTVFGSGYVNPMRAMKMGPVPAPHNPFAGGAQFPSVHFGQPPRPEGVQESVKPVPVSGGGVEAGEAGEQTVAATVAVESPLVEGSPRNVGHREVELKDESWWTKTKKKIQRSLLTCFCLGDIASDWELDDQFRRRVGQEMCEVVSAHTDKTVTETIVAEVHELNREKVHHVPRIVAHATVALRMKLGLGAMDRTVPGNVAVVRAEAAKLLRDWNVRPMQAAAHLLEIERCFFEDDTHYRLTTWRARAVRNSRLVRWFLGNSDPVGFDF